jgi:hypothetical protein
MNMARRRSSQITAATTPVQNKTMAEIAAGYGCPEVAVDPVATGNGEEGMTATQPIPVQTLAELLEEITRSGGQNPA